jgi:hypothetical protein
MLKSQPFSNNSLLILLFAVPLRLKKFLNLRITKNEQKHYDFGGNARSIVLPHLEG